MGGPDATSDRWKQSSSAVRVSGGYPGNDFLQLWQVFGPWASPCGKWANDHDSAQLSVLPKVFWAPMAHQSSWNLPVRMEGSLVRNFNNYYVLLIHVFDGCSNRFDPCDHFNLVCCCLSPVLISDKKSCWKISQSLKPIWLVVEMLVLLFKKKSISAAEMPVKFQSKWKTQRGLAKSCDRTSNVILNQPQDLFSVQQTQVW